ncbi:hypothetical protein D3C81_1893400 [compost metagenome]
MQQVVALKEAIVANDKGAELNPPRLRTHILHQRTLPLGVFMQLHPAADRG